MLQAVSGSAVFPLGSLILCVPLGSAGQKVALQGGRPHAVLRKMLLILFLVPAQPAAPQKS